MASLPAIVEAELSRMTDPRLVRFVRDWMVVPYSMERYWDYGSPGQKYLCWTVLEHRPSNTAVVYCDSGFGPSHPWGIIFLAGDYTGIGMDSAWYATLEAAVRESAGCDLPMPPECEVD